MTFRSAYLVTLTRLLGKWTLFWLRRSGRSVIGRFAARIACLGTLPYHHRSHFANRCVDGFIAPSAVISNPLLLLGKHVYVGDRVLIARNRAGGSVRIADRAHIYGDSCLETGLGGNIQIGHGTHMQPGCRLHAYISDIVIGSRVEIAPNCAFYSYDHSMTADQPIMDQPLASDGAIVVGDGAWIGHGVTILQGVQVGAGAVIGAGAVVVNDIPENAIAVGVPAHVVGYRPLASVPAPSNMRMRKVGVSA